MVVLIKNSFKDLRHTYKKHISFEFLYMLITSFVFVPVIAYIFNRVLLTIGSGPLLNKDIVKVVLNYRGLIGLGFISFIAVIILFVQFGVSLIIAQKQYFGKKVSISYAFIAVIKKIPRILSFSVFQLATLFIFLLPIIDSPLLASFLHEIDFELFIKNKIVDSNTYLSLYGLGVLIASYIIIRWIFTLHFIIIEGKHTRAAIKSSIQMTKRNQTGIIIAIFLLNILVFSTGLAIISGISSLPAILFKKVDIYLIDNISLTLSSFMTYLLALALIPINVTFITRLYYRFKKNEGIEVVDHLPDYQSDKYRKMDERISNFFIKRKVFHIGLVVMYIIMSFLVYYSMTDSFVYMGRRVAIAGHRGDKYSAPENSMSAILSAIEKGVDFVEIDVQITRDGVVVLNHDIDLERVAGVSRRVFESDYSEISRVDIGYRFSEEFVGERIPTLRQVLEETKGKIKILIDLKPYGSDIPLIEGVIALIEEFEMVEECYIQSFDNKLLQEIRKRNPNIKIGQLMYAVTGSLAGLDVDFYSIEQSILSHRIINNARARNREVWVWTVSKERNIKQVLKYDIDGIITGRPERVKAIIGLD